LAPPILAAGIGATTPIRQTNNRPDQEEVNMGSEFTPLPELAKEAGATLNQVRHWIEALGFEVVMVGGVRHVNQDGV